MWPHKNSRKIRAPTKHVDKYRVTDGKEALCPDRRSGEVFARPHVFIQVDRTAQREIRQAVSTHTPLPDRDMIFIKIRV